MFLRIFLLTTLCLVCARQGLRPMDDETYDIILKALRGEFHVPVADRTKCQRSALVRLWRNRNQYSLSDDRESILWNGKLVLKMSAIPEIAKTGYDATKGSNAWKVNIRLSIADCVKKQFSGNWINRDSSSCWEQNFQTGHLWSQLQLNRFKKDTK